MASIVVAGDTSGTVTLAAPATAGTTTLTLPTANGTLITTGSSGQSIPRAALPAGSVLQVVQATTTSTASTTSASFIDTNLTGTITPQFSSSRILILIAQRIFAAPGSSGNASSAIQILRNGTQVWYINRYGLTDTSGAGGDSYFSAVYLDSPATTSALTYKTQFNRQNGSNVVYAQLDSDVSSIILMEIAA